MVALNKMEWSFLECLADAEEPFEMVDSMLSQIDSNTLPQDILEIALKLFEFGFIRIMQWPIKHIGQSFKNKDLFPKSSMDVLGDLGSFFKDYCRDRKYLWNLTLGGSQAGVPFGIWFSLTQEGRKEWGKEIYCQYYE